MKKFNLMKKIGAVVTTVAMLASMGTVAFADTPIDTVDGSIKITGYEVTKADGIYTVVVDYEATGVTGDIAMLSYISTGDDFSEIVDYGTDMQIIGVTQQTGAATGQVTFKVTDDTDANINIAGSKIAVVKIGGQGEGVTPAAALIDLTIVEPWNVVSGLIEDAIAVDTASEELEVTVAEIKAAMTDGNYTAVVYGANEETAEVAITNAMLDSIAESDNGTNAYMLTVPAGTAVTDSDPAGAKIATDIKVYFDIEATYIPPTPWTATDVTITDAVTVAKADLEAEDAVVVDIVKAAIMKTGVKAIAEGKTAALAADNVNVVAEWDGEAAEFTATVTFDADPVVKDVLGAAVEGLADIAAKTVTVTITEEVVPDITYGDINGDGEIDMIDVGAAYKHYMEIEELTGDAFLAADVDGTEEIDMIDVGNIYKFYMEIIDTFPIEEK